jgi:hypothetical protein
MGQKNHAYDTLLKGLRDRGVNKSFIALEIEKKEIQLRKELSNKN